MFIQWLILVASLIGGGALAAGPSDLPPVDPPNRWHVLTQDDSTSDSKCIGNPVTPLCAVETIHACFVREDDRLCQIGMGLDHPPGLVHVIDLEGLVGLGERYRIVGAEKIGKKRHPQINGERPDVDDIVIKTMDVLCRGSKCEKPMGPPTSYLIRITGGRWAVITWDTPPW